MTTTPTASADAELPQQEHDRPGPSRNPIAIPTDAPSDDHGKRDGMGPLRLEQPRLAQPLDHVKEHGREKNAEQRHAEHPAEDGDAERVAHFGPRPVGQHQGNHAEDKSERSHQDRPQTKSRCFFRGVEARFSLFVKLPGEFDDQDRIFAGQAKQHDQPDLHENIDVAMRDQHADHGAEQTQRHVQNHGQRQPPTFIERRQRQKHASHGQCEHVHRRVAGPELQEHQFGPIGFHRNRQCFVGQRVDLGDGVAGTEPRLQISRHGGGRVEIVALHGDWTADFARVDQRAQRDHLAGLIADLQQVDVRLAVAEVSIGLDRHLPVAAKIVEAVDIQRAQVHLQRLIHIVERNAQRLGLEPVDVHEKLRRVRAELRGDADPARARSFAFSDQARRSAVAKRRSPSPPRSSIIVLKPPATPSPGIGDAP